MNIGHSRYTEDKLSADGSLMDSSSLGSSTIRLMDAFRGRTLIEELMTKENWVKVTLQPAPEIGEVVGVTIGDKQIAIYNIDGALYATDNVCTHAFALLSEGYLEGDTIECPLHAGRFDVKTGKGLGPPIQCNIRTFPVRSDGDIVEVDTG